MRCGRGPKPSAAETSWFASSASWRSLRCRSSGRPSAGTTGVPGEDLARLARRGKYEKTLVFPHQRAVHLRVVIPSERRSERLRIQFTPGRESGPRFSVQARHPNAAQLPLPIQENLRRIAEELRLTWGFQEASELTDFRTRWSRSYALEEWLGDGGPTVVDRLLRLVREDVETLAATGIFDRRDGIAYRSEQTPEPAAERDADEADEE